MKKASFSSTAILVALITTIVLFKYVDSQLDFSRVPKGVHRPWFKSVDFLQAQESRNRYKNGHPHKKVMGYVPIIPDNKPTPKWIPGELIANEITKRQVRLVDESQYGPLKSVTMFPGIRAAILVFNKRYHPERLAEVLKYNYGIEGEPNGIILQATN